MRIPASRALLIVAVLAGQARADQPVGVEVADLPPLPPASDEQSSTATVLAAASAEEDIVVGAAKREQSLGNVASAVTVVSGDRLRRFGYRTVGEALAAVAGVYLADTRISYALGIRGLNIPGDFNTRILVLIDGATVNEPWGSFAGLGFETLVSIDEIARIELIRGPVSSLYGANAFLGIVNIVTRSAAETPRAWGRVGIHSITGAVSSAGFSAGNVHEQLRAAVSAMTRIGDASTAPGIGSNLTSDASRSFTGSLVGSYHGTFAQIRAYRYFRDSPFAPYVGDPTADRPYRQYDTQLLVEGGHAHDLSKRASITARAYASTYAFRDDIAQIGASPFLDFGTGTVFGTEVRGHYDVAGPAHIGITGGTEASYYITRSRAYERGDEANAAEVPKKFDIEGVYAEADAQPTPWLGFSGGLRFDRNSVIDRRLSPRLAAFLSNRDRYGVKLLYAQGFRNPSAYEAFFFDDMTFSQPRNLRAETIRSFEAVLWAKPVIGLSTRLSVFHWSANDVVEQLPDPDNPVLQQFQNAARFISQGVEVEGSYRTSRGWYLFGGGTLARVGNAEDPTAPVVYHNVPNAAQTVGSFGASTPPLVGRMHVSAELLYVGERPVRGDKETGMALAPAPAWVGVNGAIYVPNLRGFDITAGVRNLIGKRQRVVAASDYDRYDASSMTYTTIPTVPGEGREVYVKVGYSY